jgi:phage terminase large subunit-like protein
LGRKLEAVTKYATLVERGKVVAGPLVRAACRRHLDELDTRGFPYKFDRDLVARVFGFFDDILCLNGGEFEGAPFHLELWQAFIVGSLFGWVDEEGARRFRVAYIEAGKGQGKSPLAAGIGHYMLVADGESRAEVYAAATKKDQAMILFRDAVAMVDLSPELSRVIQKVGGKNPWNMVYKSSFFRAISSDDGQSGPRPHCALVDEIHEHKDDVVIEMLRAGFKGRRQPLLFLITNAGTDRNSVCFRLHDYGARVAQRMADDPRFFSYICALDPGDDPFVDESVWLKTNPNLGVTIQPPYIRDQVHEARGMPAKESTVRRLHFCQWTDAANPWISGDAWRKCEFDTEQSFEELFAGARVFLGIDLSATTDLTALAAVGVFEEQGKPTRLVAAAEFWTPGDTLLERSARDRVPFDVWVRQGWLHSVPGKTLDYAPVAERLAHLVAALDVRAVVFDRYRMSYLRDELDSIGAGDVPLIEHPQGFIRPKDSPLWMPQSISDLEAAILGERIAIARNPVLTWNAASAVVEQDRTGGRIFAKRKSLARIDGVVALAMAVGAASVDLSPELTEGALFFL